MTTVVVDYYPTYDFKFVTGDYVRRRVLVEDPDPTSPDPENPIMIPRDWTGWTGRAQIRIDTKRTTEITATFVVTLGEDAIDDGFIVLELLEGESEKVLRNNGWDLELKDPDGKPETVLGGKVVPRLDYTR